MGSNVKNSQKRHILARVCVVWATMRENPSRCLTCRWVPQKKGINKNNFGYISPMCPEVPLGRICTWFGIAVGVADVITCDKFFGDRLRGVDSVGGWKLPFPTQPVISKTATGPASNLDVRKAMVMVWPRVTTVQLINNWSKRCCRYSNNGHCNRFFKWFRHGKTDDMLLCQMIDILHDVSSSTDIV